MKQLRKWSLAVAAVLSLGMSQVWAQHKCGTDHVHQTVLDQNPAAAKRMAATEQEVNQWIANRSNAKNTQSTYVIPVVFHVIHNNGPENVSSARILQTLEQLNADYNRHNTDLNQVEAAFTGITGDVSIEFRLATRDPQGNCTDGITRTQSALTNTAGDNVKNLIVWDPTRYLNIWVVNTIDIGISGGVVLGYAYFPGGAPSLNTEGVVVIEETIGANIAGTSTRRTLTHEIGHYLGLLHTWGNGPNGQCGGSDQVADTPPTSGVQDVCPRNFRPCSVSGTPVQANVQNYMDYSSCAIMFTAGQATRMQGFLNSNTSNRRNHWQQANLVATGTTATTTALNSCAPKVRITTTEQFYSCANSNVTFAADLTNQSSTTGTTFTWTIPGAIPSTATGASVSVRFPFGGIYGAKVKAVNSLGADSAEVQNVAYIYSDTAGYNGSTYLEDFSSVAGWPAVTNKPSTSWRVEATNVNNTWRIDPNIGFNGNGSMTVRNQQVSGTQNSAVTPTVDVTTITSTPRFIAFDAAYARRTTANTDELKVYLSTNCGGSWTLVGTYNANSTPSLLTRTGNTTNFIPTAADWRAFSARINVNATSGRRVQARFEMTSGGGNNIYIDNVRFIGFTNLPDNSLAQQVTLYPNPANAQTSATLALEEMQGRDVNVTIADAVGRALHNMTVHAAEDIEKVSLPTLAPGIYSVRVTMGSRGTTQKLVVQ